MGTTERVPTEEDATAVHTVLSHPIRRAVVAEVSRNEGSIEVAELAARAAESSTDSPAGTRERYRMALRHCHIPKLTANEVVEYDDDAGILSLTAMGRRVESIRRLTADRLAR